MTAEELPLSYRDPADLFARLRSLPYAVWFDGGGSGRHWLAALPRWVARGDAAGLEVTEGGDTVRLLGDPFARLAERWAAEALPRDPARPFRGGLAGYVSYDLGEALFDIAREGAAPCLHFAWYDWVLLAEPAARRARILTHPRLCPAVLAEVRAALARPAPAPAPFRLEAPFRPAWQADHYRAAFQQVAAYIAAGHCYQVNLAFPHRAPARGDPWAAYLALRARAEAPMGAFLHWEDRAVLCQSPERFLRVEGGRVTTRPIKGTRRRGNHPAEDEALAEELRTSPKERAENLMIVDLLRNDLGRNCLPGSIAVPELFAVERHPYVLHLVSTVTGRLRPDRTPLDLLRDAFPGGSVTGAPKRRAMEIIAELENAPRGVYCGSLCWLGADGDFDSNIAIRTLELSGGELRCWGGGGLVADSQWEAEYREARHKVAGLMEALEAAFSG
ncbi:MAG: aminodeoxychorismate synthase component I [Porticoccaceae bacterium]|nr:MAG: aminodeoxychorismate synthase component I [Porticoccaceae bacterium]